MALSACPPNVGKITLTQSYTIHSIESYFSGIRPGGITFSLHAAIPNSLKPGSIFFGDQILIQEYGSEYSSSWHGISNLNLQLDAGTYWLYLTPDLSFEGLMPAIAATPLDSYTQGGSGIWFEGGPDSFDYLNLAFRIDGTPLTNQSVPEPGTLFLICVALGGFAASRRKVQN
jgi:hypothetical protein